ncbi:hypothetical protein BDY21DRAFT_102108 [Lineolata rhizophorae]|uniref:Swi5-dependent recombination DNA repair protein 1 n=1 Tax=Lineolata rhizophorae TaxID=578093 RepID=A0A6A6NTH7_9PEZI|nr:hypothetical protein BDY21DRAFT_102108 [Lineolata rhizophorae]
MSTPAAKRRRLEASANVLSRPFKSPFRSSINPPQGSSESNATTLANNASASQKETSSEKALLRAKTKSDVNPYVGSPETELGGDGKKPGAEPVLRGMTCAGTAQSPITPRAAQPSASHHPAPSSTATPTASTIALSTKIAALRTEVDMLTQAIAIVSPRGRERDAELEQLRVKWRDVSRAAAEEVFAGCKERVMRMGGVGAWREREKKKEERWKDWEEGEESDGDDSEDEEDDEDEEEEDEREDDNREGTGNCIMDAEARMWAREFKREAKEVAREQKRMLKAAKEEARREKELEQERLKVEQDALEEKDDDTFTMDMMLKTLNVDLKLIGWDRELQRWVD